MKKQITRLVEFAMLASIAILNGVQTCWAGPPGPPNISTPPPSTPVGGTEVTIATVVAIAGYGIWKNRR
jgi:hypothetical protein